MFNMGVIKAVADECGRFSVLVISSLYYDINTCHLHIKHAASLL